MQLKALAYLKEVVDAGSFAGAAARLGVNGSNVTRQISALEDELGLTLLERSRSGVRLTSGGSAVMIEVRRVLNDLDAVARTARETGFGEHGEFHLGLRIPPVAGPLTTLLRQWRMEHPSVSITVHELPDHELSNAISRRSIDVAIFAGYGVYPNLVTAPLVREQLSVALPVGHRLTTQDAIFWHDLRDEVILVQDWEGSHATREYYASLFGIGLPFRCHPSSKQSVLALVAAGFGLTLVLESQAQVMVPGVTYRQILEENAKIDIVLAWAPEAEDAAVGCFVSFMRDHAPLSRLGP